MKEASGNPHTTRNKEHELMFIADSVPVHLNYLDAEERFVFVNKAAADFWQLRPDQMVGKSILELAGKEQYARVKPFIERVLQGETVSHQAPFTRPDGSIDFFMNNYIPDIDQHGRVVGFVATGTDVTVHKQAFDEVKEMARAFRELADTMPQIVWSARPDGHVDFYNKRWYDFTGLPVGSANNKLWDQILHPDDAELLYTTWTKALASGDPYEVEFRVRHAASGEYRWLLSRARAVRDADGKISKWYGSNTDIHEQKSLLQKLELEKHLREQFVSTLSHDLRTPMASARMSAQLIQKRNSDPAVLKLAIRIEDNMTRADKMIQDLLDASKLKAGHSLSVQLGECNLVELAQAVVEDFSMIHGDLYQLNAPDALVGHWDCDGLRRVLENLLSNATKYGSQGSRIEIKLSEQPAAAEIEVCNQGNPIDPSDLPYLFDTYIRTGSSKNTKGWGIGLSLVKGLVEAHGGQVRVTSNEQDGTRFGVSLPKQPPRKDS